MKYLGPKPDSLNCSKQKVPDWYWDRYRQNCVPFIYNGCGPGGYGFPTWSQCKMSCEKGKVKDFRHVVKNLRCNLPVDHGDNICGAKPGKGFYYDVKAGYCQGFDHKGCNLNTNYFPTIADCKQQCYDPKPWG